MRVRPTLQNNALKTVGNINSLVESRNHDSISNLELANIYIDKHLFSNAIFHCKTQMRDADLLDEALQISNIREVQRKDGKTFPSSAEIC